MSEQPQQTPEENQQQAQPAPQAAPLRAQAAAHPKGPEGPLTSVKEIGIFADRNARHRRTMEVSLFFFHKFMITNKKLKNK